MNNNNYINPLFPLYSFDNEYSDVFTSDSTNDKPLDQNVSAKNIYDKYFSKK